MRYLVLLACFVSVGCGKAYQTPEVAEIVNDFESTYNIDASGTTIDFIDSYSSDTPNRVGECNAIANHVTLLRKFWINADPDTQKILLFHELGHCVFHRRHTSEMYSDHFCPVSIMYPSVVPLYCWDQHKDDYIKELPLGH